jgi:TRAP-type uncharacterized transport system substrate-binding protein
MFDNIETTTDKQKLNIYNIILRVLIGTITITIMSYLIYMFSGDALGYNPQLRISGGATTGTRHILARALAKESLKTNFELQTIVTPGALTVLDMINEGSLDYGIIPGGLPTDYPNVIHVATLNPMPVTIYVSNNIKTVDDFKGNYIDVGKIATGLPNVVKPILNFLKLREDIDYIATNYGSIELQRLNKDQLPKIIIDVNYSPSDIGDYLINKMGYKILDLDFGDSLKLRYPQFSNQVIQKFTYLIEPKFDLKTLGVVQHIISNKGVPDRLTYKLLEALYSPGVSSTMQLKFDQSLITEPSGFALSKATSNFLDRGGFVLTPDIMHRFIAWVKIIVVLLIGYLILKQALDFSPKFDDAKLKGYFAEIADIEKNYSALKATGHLTEESIIIFSSRLSDIKRYAMESLPKASKANKGNISELFICINDARQAISSDNSNNLKKTNSENLLNLFKNVTKR